MARRVGLTAEIEPAEASFLFEGANEWDYVTIRNHILARWRAEPNAYVAVETACSWFMNKQRPLVHCAHRFLTTCGYVNFGVGFTSNYLAPGTSRGTVVVVGAIRRVGGARFARNLATAWSSSRRAIARADACGPRVCQGPIRRRARRWRRPGRWEGASSRGRTGTR